MLSRVNKPHSPYKHQLTASTSQRDFTPTGALKITQSVAALPRNQVEKENRTGFSASKPTV